MAGRGFWTPEASDRAVELWRKGYSASQISVYLDNGVSRNAVIGRLGRLGYLGRGEKREKPEKTLSGGGATSISPKTRRPPLSRLVKPGPTLTAPPEKPENDEASAIEFQMPSESGIEVFDLNNRTCRWPHGDPGDPGFYFCGVEEADLERGRPYCPHHSRKAVDGARTRASRSVIKRIEKSLMGGAA